ncbi:MAG: diguanylate cyclase [Steroidobacteraceae bacterium]
MNANTGTEDWRTKYFNSLRSLESEEQQFRAMEAILKRVMGRLCIASLRQSPQLDAEIRKLQSAIRGETTSTQLEQLLPALTEAIHALDGATSETGILTQTNVALKGIAPSIIAKDEQVRAILSAMASKLKRDAELLEPVAALDTQLSTPMTTEQLPEVLASLAELFSQRLQRIERSKREMETLLNQMADKLDDISHHIADQNQDQTRQFASSESLNLQLIDDMKAMGESADSATELVQIRMQVRRRIDSIGKYLQEYKEQEAIRAGAMRVRNEQMQARVAQLEAEARKLQTQLEQEQKLALIDVLTKVPNRAAYEKRLDEEFKRWQRFNQPTCIAALDIDHFKRINDNYGHPAGDRVLRIIGEGLSGLIRGTDFLARYGGEEFVMIFSGTHVDDALQLLNKIRISVSELGFHFRGSPVTITLSCGVTELQEGDTPATAFERADKALYQAKNNGRNCCVSL